MQMIKLKFFIAVSIIVGILPAYGWTAEPWLIASQSEAINFGQKITFDIVKPQDVSD